MQSWLYGDHFEVWLGPGDGDSHCEDGSLEPTQWAVLPSGEVIKAHGPATQAPRVEVRQGAKGSAQAKWMTAILRFAERPERITVVYSDSDDGRSQKRLIATSPLVFGKNETLGEAADVNESAARCSQGPRIERTSWGDVSPHPISVK
jgi:hypothetical protein